ncbi:MAG: hypothetical protein IPL81_06405 [Flavobacteriales bacterium]|nr:hypothetical protein [Flavobacteriales bacterium]
MSNHRTLMKELNDNEELQRSAPTLFGLPKQDPFVMEDGFFARFPHVVQALVSAPRSTHYGIWLKRAAFALPVVALIAFGIHRLSDDTLPSGNAVTSITISPDEADQYMASTHLDTQELLADLPASAWPDLGTVTVQLSPDEALAYVDQENIDLTDLILAQ